MKISRTVIPGLFLCYAQALQDASQIRRLGEPLSEETFHHRRLASALDVVGNNGEPVNDYPLDRCEGDCDRDSECKSGLICFKRENNEEVPGCTDDQSSYAGEDFCIDPDDLYPPTPSGGSFSSLNTRGNNGSPSSSFPLGKCQGDCDRDSECQGTLECYQRTGSESVPGCSGSGDYGKDYCYDPNDDNRPSPTPPAPTPTNPAPTGGGSSSLVKTGDNGSPPSAFPLDKCQGDCDRDSDCRGSLECYQRTGSESVPGCSGSGDNGKDYCYDPSDDNRPTPPAPFPTPPAPTPTNPAPTSSSDLRIRGNDGQPTSNFPLERCEGDCDNDSECKGSLECYQRTGSESVPGCTGNGDAGRDYCYDPNDGGPTPTPPSPSPPTGGGGGGPSFRIKLYWERGYYWQEESVERKWCMDCEGSKCNNGDIIKLDKCRDSNPRFQFLSNSQVQIKVKDSNLCLELQGSRDIRVRNCDSSEDRQLFTAGRGDFDGDRFELIPVAIYGCLSQKHHPKDDEEVYRETCDLAREHDTSYWNKY